MAAPLGPFIMRSDLGGSLRTLDAEGQAALRAAINDSGKRWVWIDGFTGAGKTTLAQSLAKELGWPLLDLDDCAHDGDEPLKPYTYAAQLCPKKLHSEFESLRARGCGLISGVCLREVVPFSRPDSFAVYVARCSEPVSGQLCWHDSLTLDEIPSGSRWLDASIHHYHLAHKPHEDADFVLCRVEE